MKAAICYEYGKPLVIEDVDLAAVAYATHITAAYDAVSNIYTAAIAATAAADAAAAAAADAAAADAAAAAAAARGKENAWMVSPLRVIIRKYEVNDDN